MVNESEKALNLVHDRRMNPIMNINDLKTIEQVEQFLTGTQAVAFLVTDSKDECYRGIKRILLRFKYTSLNKRSRGTLIRFLIKITGYSRQQMTRLVQQCRDTGEIERKQRTYQGFERLYTRKRQIYECVLWIRLLKINCLCHKWSHESISQNRRT